MSGKKKPAPWMDRIRAGSWMDAENALVVKGFIADRHWSLKTFLRKCWQIDQIMDPDTVTVEQRRLIRAVLITLATEVAEANP